jgi:class 3 adenylate cyclase
VGVSGVTVNAVEPMEQVAASEERKLATVVFADLVGSTALGGAQDPERTRMLLERFYDAMTEEIEAVGGTVEKFAGDAVMAAFGAPTALEDHAERALHAGLAMQRRLAELFPGRLELRIGVDTGEVVVGRPREGSSFVTGDSVNVAARLEQAAAPGEILVGERTIVSARGAFEFDEPMVVEAKGKAGGVSCRRLVRALSLMRPRGVGGLQTAFVGRDAELEALREAYRQVLAERRPYLVTILGDAGVGKTRLAGEFWSWLAAESPETLRRTGRCLPYGRGITYWALGEILKEHFGLLESDSPETLLRRLEGREILALTLGLDIARDLHPLVARDRLHGAWVELISEFAAGRPTVVLVEDLHWAEDDLLDLLELLLRAADGPLLLLATARSELLDQRRGWGGARRAAATIELEPLSPADARRMLDELLASELPEDVRRVIVEHGEGNPFFVEELLGTLIDRGILARTNGSWTARELPAGFAIPDSVQAVVAARIDLLPPGEKAALQAASVIGRAFWLGPVYELVPDAEPDFRVLEERDFVRRRAGSSIAGETELVFKHQLTREVAYGSLPKARRARLHARFAAWLELFGRGRNEYAPLLAHHLAEAVRPEDVDLAWAGAPNELERLREQAVTWLRRAAELAIGRYEIGEALALFDRAHALAAADRTRIEILRQIARAHEFNYDMERFRQALEEAIALSPERAVAAEIYADLACFGYGRAYMWKEPPPEELGERWLATALELAEPGTEARGFALLARALAAPETEAGAEAAKEALALGEALDNPRLVLQGCEAQTLVASASGRFKEACEWADRAREVGPRETDPGWRAHQFFLGGFVYLRAGRIADVPRFADEFDRLVPLLTPHDEMHAVALRSVLESSRGCWPALRELTARAEAASDANVETPCQFNWRSLLVCALGLAHLGEELEARRLEERACAGAVVAGPPEREPALLRLALLRGDLETAERILERLPTGVDPWGLDAAAARLDALAALGDRARVEAEAASFLEEESYTHPFALRALGLVSGPRALLEQAAAAFEALGLEWQAGETKALLTKRIIPRGPA